LAVSNDWGVTRSCENAVVKVFRRIPIVRDTGRPEKAPAALMDDTEESDCHLVVSEEVNPSLSEDENPERPKS
jgi:hypothetical protein